MDGRLDIYFEIDFDEHIVVKTSMGKTFTVIISSETFYHDLEGNIKDITKELWEIKDRAEEEKCLNSAKIHQLIGFLNGIEIIFRLLVTSRVEIIP